MVSMNITVSRYMSTPLTSESLNRSIEADSNNSHVSFSSGHSVEGTSTVPTSSLSGPSHSSEGAGPSRSMPYTSISL